MSEASKRRELAFEIWRAGVAAVDSERLVRNVVKVTADGLEIAGVRWSSSTGRICVVGAGKAGAGMVRGMEASLPPEFLDRLSGWVNVPEDCVAAGTRIHLHGARPAGVNEPTAAGVQGTREILQRVAQLSQEDLCIVLISGGGSALLPAPIAGVSLAEKQQVTRALMLSGATIQELNTVRRALSEVKGGGLLRATRAGQLVALIISDVSGDPLETIASGPTVDVPPDPAAALAVLERYTEKLSQQGAEQAIPASIFDVLQQQLAQPSTSAASICPEYANHIIGNNRTAVEAAATQAAALGYEVVETLWDQAGVAAELGYELVNRCRQLREQSLPGKRYCIITGGEPIVHLALTELPRKGGRNQELVLAAGVALLGLPPAVAEQIVILSGGTDGEDGPTDAAGGLIDLELLQQANAAGLDPQEYLRINNSYPYLDQIGGLIRSGPTHTNVMDLRVALVHT